MYKCKHMRYDCTNFHVFIKKITQRFCTTPPFYSEESRRKQISIGWKSEATEATQSCKQQPWLPLWLSVSLTALLIHLRHNTQQTHATWSQQFIIKNILSQVFHRCYKNHDFWGKNDWNCRILMCRH